MASNKKQNDRQEARKSDFGPGNVPLFDLLGMFARSPHLDPDDAAAFETDLEAGRTEFDSQPLRDPWQQ